jgi:hypothetical protein
MDTDSSIESPIPYDIIQLMEDNNYVYSVRAESGEPDYVVTQLRNFTRQFRSDYAHLNPLLPKWVAENEGVLETYYNNFEIINIEAYIANPVVQAYTKAVNDSYNIYTRRWGDSPLRTLVIRMAFPSDRIKVLCSFDYYHQAMFESKC